MVKYLKIGVEFSRVRTYTRICARFNWLENYC